MTKIFYIAVLFILILSGISTKAQEYYSSERMSFDTRYYDEFSPAYFQDGLVFCSNRKNDLLITYRDTTNSPLISYFYVERKDSLKWGSPHSLSLNEKTQQGPLVFTADGSKVFFTRSYDVPEGFFRKQQNNTKLGIFIASVNGDNFGQPIPFTFNDKDYNIMHPAINKDGTELVFASDQPGGYGGFDLYISRLVNGKWTNPQNLGKEVNSKEHEAFPYFHSSGRLYYASKGHNSQGGFDIFYTQLIDGRWSRPVHLTTPFNSASDDFSFIAADDMQQGFFSSNRENSDDIFHFTSTLPLFSECKEQEENDYCYVFFDQTAARLDTAATFMYQWDMGDGTVMPGDTVEHCFEGPGVYIVQLNVVDTLTNEVSRNQASYMLEVEDIEQAYLTAPDTAAVGQQIKFNGSESYLKRNQAKQYYWDFGDGYHAVGLDASHSFRVPGTYRVKLGITANDPQTGNEVKYCSWRNITITPE